MRYVASSTVLRLLFGPAHLQLGLYLSALGNTPPPLLVPFHVAFTLAYAPL